MAHREPGRGQGVLPAQQTPGGLHAPASTRMEGAQALSRWGPLTTASPHAAVPTLDGSRRCGFGGLEVPPLAHRAALFPTSVGGP